jgi:hypothetical protein
VIKDKWGNVKDSSRSILLIINLVLIWGEHQCTCVLVLVTFSLFTG